MADIVVTAADVSAASTAVVTSTTAGATIAAGQTVYFDSSDSNKAKLADADNTSTTATVKGVAINSASSGQPISVCTSGDLTLSAVMTVGEIYVLSGTAGGIAPEADLASSDYVTVLGVATSTSVLKLSVLNSGVQVP